MSAERSLSDVVQCIEAPLLENVAVSGRYGSAVGPCRATMRRTAAGAPGPRARQRRGADGELDAARWGPARST